MARNREILAVMREATIGASLGCLGKEKMDKLMEKVWPKAERLQVVRDPWYKSNPGVRMHLVGGLTWRLKKFRKCPRVAWRWPYLAFKSSLPLYYNRACNRGR